MIRENCKLLLLERMKKKGCFVVFLKISRTGKFILEILNSENPENPDKLLENAIPFFYFSNFV